MNGGSRVVIDASIAVKWVLRDEQDSDLAAVLLQAFLDQRLSLVAPSFIRYEAGNTLEVARRRGRISRDEAATGLSFIVGLGVHVSQDSDDLVLRAHRVAQEIGATVYDSVYVSFAELLGADFVTADLQLVDQVDDYPVRAFPLGQFVEAL